MHKSHIDFVPPIDVLCHQYAERGSGDSGHWTVAPIGLSAEPIRLQLSHDYRWADHKAMAEYTACTHHACVHSYLWYLMNFYSWQCHVTAFQPTTVKWPESLDPLFVCWWRHPALQKAGVWFTRLHFANDDLEGATITSSLLILGQAKLINNFSGPHASEEVGHASSVRHQHIT